VVTVVLDASAYEGGKVPHRNKREDGLNPVKTETTKEQEGPKGNQNKCGLDVNLGGAPARFLKLAKSSTDSSF